MEEKGLIERTRDPKDRRAYSLSLTSPGREAVLRANPELESVFAPLAAMLGENEARAVLPVLERILDKVNR